MQAQCQISTSQCYNQSFVKELAKPIHRKNCFKNLLTPKKNTTATPRILTRDPIKP